MARSLLVGVDTVDDFLLLALIFLFGVGHAFPDMRQCPEGDARRIRRNVLNGEFAIAGLDNGALNDVGYPCGAIFVVGEIDPHRNCKWACRRQVRFGPTADKVRSASLPLISLLPDGLKSMRPQHGRCCGLRKEVD